MERLRSYIGAIRPDKRVEFGMDGELLEERLILERLEDLPIQLVTEIDISLGAIGETKVDHIILNVTRSTTRVSFHYSNGAILLAGRPL